MDGDLVGNDAKLAAISLTLSVIFQIAHATVRKLSDVKGISEAKVAKLKEIVKSMVSMDFRTAADALEDRKYVFRVVVRE
jgi:hypothetical protein